MRRTFATLMLSALIAAPAIARDDHVHWPTSPRELRKRVRSICVWPIAIDFDVVDWEQRRVWVEAFLAWSLEESGYRVVSAEKLRAALVAAEQRAGGFFDPLDGTRDHDRERMARASVLGQPTLQCDAHLEGRFALVRANVLSNDARWDGVTEKVAPTTYVSSVYGWMTATSFELELRDSAGELLYSGAGGVQATTKLDAAGNAVATPERDLLSDPQRNALGIAIALDRVLEPGGSDETLACLKSSYTHAMLAAGAKPRAPVRAVVVRWAQLEREGVRANGACLVRAMAAARPDSEAAK